MESSENQVPIKLQNALKEYHKFNYLKVANDLNFYGNPELLKIYISLKLSDEINWLLIEGFSNFYIGRYSKSLDIGKRLNKLIIAEINQIEEKSLLNNKYHKKLLYSLLYSQIIQGYNFYRLGKIKDLNTILTEIKKVKKKHEVLFNTHINDYDKKKQQESQVNCLILEYYCEYLDGNPKSAISLMNKTEKISRENDSRYL